MDRRPFSPATVAIRWKNNDTHNHQVVSTTGTFASPVLAPGILFEFVQPAPTGPATLPTSIGTIKVAGAPPGSHARDVAAANHVRHTHHPLSGQKSTARASENVQLNYLHTGRAPRPSLRP